MTTARGRVLLGVAALFLGTLLLFGRAAAFDFVSLDDDLYVTRNAAVRSGLTLRGISWAATTTHAANWHPLTWLSLMLDAELFGPGPAGFHRTNVLLHGASAALLFLALARMTRRSGRSFVVAALFAVHPLHVESVAWISERKDVLSGLLFVGILLAYQRYAQQPSLRRMGLVAALCALGLASKPMLVTVPLILLLLDVWPLARVPAGERSPLTRCWPLVREKAPLFLLSAAAACATWFAQSAAGALEAQAPVPLFARVAQAFLALGAYVEKTLWPAGLAVFYPHPGASPPWARAALSMILSAALTWLALRARRRAPYVSVGWLWYCVMLLPVLGIVQVGRQGMADRYTYLPLIGLFLVLVWGTADLVEYLPILASRRRGALGIAAGLTLACLVPSTWQQLGTWRSSRTLFDHARTVVPGNYLAEAAFGTELSREGHADEALLRIREALRIEPDFAEGHYALGTVLASLGRTDEAASEFAQAVKLEPGFAEARASLGLALLRQGRRADAAIELRRALDTDPDQAPAHAYLAGILLEDGKLDEARLHCERALSIDPASAGAHHNLALVHVRSGDLEGARRELEAAIRSEPRYLDSRLVLGAVLEKLGEHAASRARFEEVLELDPANAQARRRLASTQAP